MVTGRLGQVSAAQDAVATMSPESAAIIRCMIARGARFGELQCVDIYK
jgi:hypothetical protein